MAWCESIYPRSRHSSRRGGRRFGQACCRENQRAASGDNTSFRTILQWVWEKNRDQHEFFIEESFPIRWTYDYAVPHGLLYKLNRTKLEVLPKEIVDRDFAFWKEYSDRLLGDPNFKSDFDARRSFSKLRQTIANIYRHRGMSAEAERAYREALALWPGNAEALVALTSYLWDRGNFEEAIELHDQALTDDPNSIDYGDFGSMRKAQGKPRVRFAPRRCWPITKEAKPPQVDSVSCGKETNSRPAPAGAVTFPGWICCDLSFAIMRSVANWLKRSSQPSIHCGDFKRPELPSSRTGVLRTEQKERILRGGSRCNQAGRAFLAKSLS
jgi:tetratricopeptide (TPR) repeat protein